MSKRVNFVTSRVTPEEEAELKQVAAEHERTVSQLMRIAVREFIANYKRQKAQANQ